MGAAALQTRRLPVVHAIVLAVLAVAAVVTQLHLEDEFAGPTQTRTVSWIRSSALMRRLVPGFNALWADIYWVRAVQYFGRTRLSTDPNKNYDDLYPLLEMTTALDPDFSMAYRLGAILLSEGYPNGPGNTDQALALLERGMREAPGKWQYLHDAGFVHYWWRRDPKTAGQWFLKASALHGAPTWIRQVGATMIAAGGDRDMARALWQQMLVESEHEWAQLAARRGLLQLDAEAHIELLQPIVNRFYDDHGRFPKAWFELVLAKRLRRNPVDPTGVEYALDPVSGAVGVGRKSSLYPLPGR